MSRQLIPNIGPAERRQRLVSGVAALAAGVLLAAALVLSGAAWWWRLLVFFPFWAGALGVFQYRERT